MSRVGKIARLLREIREELNRRMDDGEPGSKLLPWLEGLPAVKQVMAEQFGGAAITKCNLSHWRKGGFGEWRAERDLLARARDLPREADEFEAAAGGDITNKLATVVAAHYARALAGWDGESNAAFRARLKVLKELSRPIVALRRGDHHLARLKFDKERLEYAWEKLGDKAKGGHFGLEEAVGIVREMIGGDPAENPPEQPATATVAGLALAPDGQGQEIDGGADHPPFREEEGRAGEGRQLDPPVKGRENSDETEVPRQLVNQITTSSPRPSPPQVCGGEGVSGAHERADVPETSGVSIVARGATGQPVCNRLNQVEVNRTICFFSRRACGKPGWARHRAGGLNRRTRHEWPKNRLRGERKPYWRGPPAHGSPSRTFHHRGGGLSGLNAECLVVDTPRLLWSAATRRTDDPMRGGIGRVAHNNHEM